MKNTNKPDNDKNIEEMFLQKMREAEIQPPLHLWAKIEQNIENPSKDTFENGFKAVFENAEKNVPSHLWQRIEAQLPQKDTKKPVFFNWKRQASIAALFLMLGGSVAYWLVEKNTEKPIFTHQNTSKGIGREVGNSVISPKETTKIITENTPKESVEIAQNTVVFSKEETKMPSTSTQHAVPAHQKPFGDAAVSSQKTNTFSPSLVSNAIEKKSSIEKPIKKASDYAELEKESFSNQSKNLSDFAPIHHEEKSFGLEKTNVIVIEPQEIEEPFLNIEEEKLLSSSATSQPVKANKSNVKKRFSLGIMAHYGTIKPVFTLQETSSIDVPKADSLAIQKELTNATPIGKAKGIGIDISINCSPAWTLHSGIYWNHYNYEVGITPYKKEIISIGGALGDTLYVMIPQKTTIKTTYYTVGLPLYLGYNIGKGRWKGNLMVGLWNEILFRNEYQSSSTVYTLKMPAHQHLNSSFLLGAGTQYEFSQRSQVVLGVHFRSSLRSWLQDRHSRMTFDNLMLHTGYRFSF